MIDLEDLRDWAWIECQNENKTTGRCRLTDEGLEAFLFSSTEKLIWPDVSQLQLTTETAKIITCLDAYLGGSGTTFNEDGSVAMQTVHSSSIMLGYSAWKRDQRSNLASTRVDGSLNFFGRLPKLIREGAIPRSEYGEVEILSASVGGATVSLSCTTTNDQRIFDNVSIEDISVIIKSDEGVEISELRVMLVWTMLFLSLLEGRKVGSGFVSILTDGSDPQSFSLNFKVPSMQAQQQHVFPIDYIQKPEDLTRISNNLSAWLARGSDWEGPYLGLHRYYENGNDYGTLRLVSACSWFDDITSSDRISSLSDEKRDSLRRAVTSAVEEVDPELVPQVVAKIQNLNAMSNRERIQKYFLKYYSGDTKKLSKVISKVLAGFRRRGKFAHGHSHFKDQEDFETAIEVIYILESICFHELFFPCLNLRGLSTFGRAIPFSIFTTRVSLASLEYMG